jgi:diguanylate cyclase (GGDEF)-like protein
VVNGGHPDPAHILVVDDDPVMLRLLSQILAPLGQVVTAEAGEQALATLRERDFDVVLLDVDMPGMGGFAVCATIKADPAFADLPVLFVSGHTDVETEAQGLEAGAVDYIMKPLSPPIVRARVRTQLVLRERTQALLRLASVDGLTGLANRRAFDDALSQEWRRARRNRTPLSLVMIDIDFFKLYNDHYGHQAGDDCLKQVATALAAAVERPGEMVARYGGEEFAAILPYCKAEAGVALAEKMRRQIAALEIPHAGSAIGDFVTISCGVATLFGDKSGKPLADEGALLHAADNALYSAKSSGRDRVALA